MWENSFYWMDRPKVCPIDWYRCWTSKEQTGSTDITNNKRGLIQGKGIVKEEIRQGTAHKHFLFL